MKKSVLLIFTLFVLCSNSDQTMDVNNMPAPIGNLTKLQNEDIYNGEEFEFWIDFQDDSRYSICSIDAIPFASTGNNGIHFAFLTDFGRNKNLNQAQIICVAPTYDPPVNIIAENLYEFLSLLT